RVDAGVDACRARRAGDGHPAAGGGRPSPHPGLGLLLMFEHWDWAARASLYHAKLKARDAAAIEPDHIVVGVLVEPAARMTTIAARMGLDLARLKADLCAAFPSPAPAPGSETLLSEGSKRVIAHTLVEAERLGHTGVGAMHILLGVCAEGTSPAASILA